MLHPTDVAHQNAKNQKKRGATRFPGICGDADALGVNRVTLYRALTGTYRLPGLLGRYKNLKKDQRVSKSKAGRVQTNKQQPL